MKQFLFILVAVALLFWADSCSQKKHEPVNAVSPDTIRLYPGDTIYFNGASSLDRLILIAPKS